ncbi:branched-chain amino acid ABC transporter permease [Nocardia goodfellowii]
MEQFLTFGIVGLSTAAIYAVIGSGLVLTYTTTGVFNFAHGAVGMVSAFAYWQLTVEWGVPVPVALIMVLLGLAPTMGVLIQRALRPVEGLGDAEKLVMTIALLSGLIALVQWIWSPEVARALPKFFVEQAPLRLGSATITWHQALTMAVAVAVAIGLRILLYRTRTGTEMRATVDDRALAGLVGADPVRANRTAWILGNQLAALGGILIAPTVALDAPQLSLLIVSAYTAAIFGRLRSLPMTFLGAVVIGCTESYLTGYLPQNEYLPGLRLAAPALLLFAALLLFPHGRLRGRDRRLTAVPSPTLRGAAIFGVVIVVAGIMLATVLTEADLVTYGQIFAFGVIALSFVPLAGYAGQISLCQLSMAGIGAVACARFGSEGQWWALPAAALVAAAAGAVVALPALRLSGVYLALGTAAFAVTLDRWIFTLPSFEWFGVDIGFFDQGSAELVGPRLLGFRLDTTVELTVFAAICLALATFGVAALRGSRFGRRLIALRDSEAAFAMLGGNLLLARVAVFALAAGIAGLGGALYGMHLRSVTADQFNFVSGLPLFLVAVIGGLGAVGSGVFTGTMIAGPLHAIAVLWPSAQDLAKALPGVLGIAFAGGVMREGAVPEERRRWSPVARNRIAVSVLVAGIGVLWLLRLADRINGWVLFWGAIALALGIRAWSVARERPAGHDASVEWRGVRRPWCDEDEEVLNHGLAARH